MEYIPGTPRYPEAVQLLPRLQQLYDEIESLRSVYGNGDLVVYDNPGQRLSTSVLRLSLDGYGRYGLFFYKETDGLTGGERTMIGGDTMIAELQEVHFSDKTPTDTLAALCSMIEEGIKEYYANTLLYHW